jgi:xylulose-5-phosphate/fructose-6-phosphate phosphoketolase
MEGYLKTGMHGVLVSYEAFLGIINSQIDQYLKYLKQSSRFYWRKPIASLNYIATSTSWRQDHNGFSHQNPSLINTLITKQSDNTSVYFPVDVNTLLVSMEECMKKVDSVNLIVSGKTDLPQWLNLEEAREHVKNGISIWNWAGNTKNMAGEVDSREDHVDVVLSSAGDYQTRETLAACKILKEEVPELRFQYVNVNEITRLGLGDENNPVMTQQDVNKYYTKTKPVIFNFHGYPEVIKSLTWGTSLANRMVILGYIEEGSTTTAFDMQVVNKTSRYHVCIQAVLAASKSNKIVDHHAERLIQKWQKILDDHDKYIFENADDMPIVKDFDFSF